MATYFKNTVYTQIGTTPAPVLETANNARATVIGLSLANLTDAIVLVDILLQDSTSTVGHYVKELIVPPNTSLRAVNGGEKLVLTPSNVLFVKSNTESSLDAIISYVEIT